MEGRRRFCLFLMVMTTPCSETLAARDLQATRLSAGYRRHLAAGGVAFGQWCRARGHSMATLSGDSSHMEAALALFVQHVHDKGGPYWIAKHAVLAVQTTFRHLKGHLRRAWDALQSWHLARPVRSRVPIRVELLKGICHFAVLCALNLDTGSYLAWMLFAVCMRTGFYGLMRPKELLNMTTNCIRVPMEGGFAEAFVAVLTVLEPKNRAAGGRLQARLVRDRDSVLWLTWAVRSLPKNSRLWPFSRQRFTALLSRAVSSWGSLTAGSLWGPCEQVERHT